MSYPDNGGGGGGDDDNDDEWGGGGEWEDGSLAMLSLFPPPKEPDPGIDDNRCVFVMGVLAHDANVTDNGNDDFLLKLLP